MSSFTLSLNDFRHHEQLCDGILQCLDYCSFRIHRVILSTASPYFKAVFTNSLNSQENEKIEVFVDVPSYFMNLILEYIYTGKCEVTADYVEDLLVYADRYGILGIVDICCKYLITNTSPINCIGISKFARAYFCHDLESISKLYIRHNFVKVLEESKELQDLSLEEFVEILKDDELNVKDEQTVLKAIKIWINHDQRNRAEYSPILFQCIRLNSINNIFVEVRISPYIIDTFSHPRIPYDIVFAVGGWGTGSPTSSMETYDARADRWLPCGQTNLGPRVYHAVCSLNKQLYLIGGFDGKNHFNTVNRFDPMRKVWQEKACMHEARCYVSVTTEGGQIYALGGFNGITRLSSVERYTPEQNQWKMITSMNKSRSDASATTFDGKIYIAGGINGQEILNSVEVFDPVCDQWTFLKPMTTPRSGVSLLAHKGILYAFGGYNGSDRLSTCERLNLLQSSHWQPIVDMKSVRSNFASVILDDDKIFVIGGFNGFRTISTVEYYDAVNGVWGLAKPMNMNRSGLCACIISGLSNAKDYSYHNRLAEDMEEMSSQSN